MRKNSLLIRRKKPVSDRRERTRQLILQTATGLFAAQGAESTTIDEIVEMAGVAKGTFYNYFDDRPAILATITTDIRKKLTSSIRHLNRDIEDPAEKVARAVKLYLALAILDPVSAGMLARLHDGTGDLMNRNNRHLVMDIEEGIKISRFHVPSIDVALHLVLGLSLASMRYLLSHRADKKILNGNGYAREVSQIVLQGLGMSRGDIALVLSRPFSLDHMALLRQTDAIS